MLSKVPFWTPIEWTGRPLANFADEYLRFGSNSAIEVSTLQDQVFVQAKQVKASWILTALKLATMILTFGLLPLLALIVKSVYRCRHPVFWIQKEPEPVFVSEEKFESFIGCETFESLPSSAAVIEVLIPPPREDSPLETVMPTLISMPRTYGESSPMPPPEFNLDELTSFSTDAITSPSQRSDEDEISQAELYAMIDGLFPLEKNVEPPIISPPLIDVDLAEAAFTETVSAPTGISPLGLPSPPLIRTDEAYCREYLAKVAESFRFDPDLSPDKRFHMLEWENIGSPQSKYNRLLFDYAMELLERPPPKNWYCGPNGGIIVGRPKSPVIPDTLVSRAKFAPEAKSCTPTNYSAAIAVYQSEVAPMIEALAYEAAEAIACQIILKTKDLDLKELFGVDTMVKFRFGEEIACRSLQAFQSIREHIQKSPHYIELEFAVCPKFKSFITKFQLLEWTEDFFLKRLIDSYLGPLSVNLQIECNQSLVSRVLSFFGRKLKPMDYYDLLSFDQVRSLAEEIRTAEMTRPNVVLDGPVLDGFPLKYSRLMRESHLCTMADDLAKRDMDEMDLDLTEQIFMDSDISQGVIKEIADHILDDEIDKLKEELQAIDAKKTRRAFAEGIVDDLVHQEVASLGAELSAIKAKRGISVTAEGIVEDLLNQEVVSLEEEIQAIDAKRFERTVMEAREAKKARIALAEQIADELFFKLIAQNS